MLPFIYATPHALILGLPLYWVCKGNSWTHWWVSIISGFLIGSIPLSLILLLIYNGHEDISFVGDTFIPLGLLGAIGGFSAWAVWKFLDTPSKE